MPVFWWQAEDLARRPSEEVRRVRRLERLEGPNLAFEYCRHHRPSHQHLVPIPVNAIKHFTVVVQELANELVGKALVDQARHESVMIWSYGSIRKSRVQGSSHPVSEPIIN